MTAVADKAPPADALVMFGASGDLAKKKLFPAVYRLCSRGLLDVPVTGVAIDQWSDDDLRDHARVAITDAGEDLDEKVFGQLAASMSYVSGDYLDAATFDRLREKVGDARCAVFHLAVPPSLFADVADGLAGAGLAEGSRLVVEKPFGHDLASAQELNKRLHASFDESAIYRIDHFLGKEALRNVLVYRFANTILEPIWNRQYVQSIKMTMAEEFDVEDRGAFYDSTGALRDVVQNHLLQMMTLIAMDQPASESADALRDEKLRVLRATRPLAPGDLVRGQYRGYRDVDGVAADSDVETFVALRLAIDSHRWEGVPFYIRAGKALADTVTEVSLEFRLPPRPLFIHPDDEATVPNSIRIEVKPREAVVVTMLAKRPGESMATIPVQREAASTPSLADAPEPYELLIEEAMAGDPTLFAREDSVEEAWRVVEPILTDHRSAIHYDKGSWGPAESDALVSDALGWPQEPPDRQTVAG